MDKSKRTDTALISVLFVQFRYRSFFLVSETKFAAITTDGGKHKGSAFRVKLFFPCGRGEQQQHGEKLQPARKHIENKHCLCGSGEKSEV